MSGGVRKRGRKTARIGTTSGRPMESLQRLLLKAAKEKETAEMQNAENEDEEVETPDDGMAAVETYNVYWPSKLKIGKKHPDPVVCTASLSSVESADIDYKLKLPEKIIDKGLLSALQLEAVVYASQAHERHLLDKDGSRAGFLLGMFKA